MSPLCYIAFSRRLAAREQLASFLCPFLSPSILPRSVETVRVETVSVWNSLLVHSSRLSGERPPRERFISRPLAVYPFSGLRSTYGFRLCCLRCACLIFAHSANLRFSDVGTGRSREPRFRHGAPCHAFWHAEAKSDVVQLLKSDGMHSTAGQFYIFQRSV